MTPQRVREKGGDGTQRKVTIIRGWESEEQYNDFLADIKQDMRPNDWNKHGEEITDMVKRGMFGNLDSLMDDLGGYREISKNIMRAQEGRLGWNPKMGYRVFEQDEDGNVEAHTAQGEEIELINKARLNYREELEKWNKKYGPGSGFKGTPPVPKPQKPISGSTAATGFTAETRFKR